MMYLSEHSIPNFDHYKELFGPFFDSGLPSGYQDMKELIFVLLEIHEDVEVNLRDVRDELQNVNSRWNQRRQEVSPDLRYGMMSVDKYAEYLKSLLAPLEFRHVKSTLRIRAARYLAEENYSAAYSVLGEYESYIEHLRASSTESSN